MKILQDTFINCSLPLHFDEERILHLSDLHLGFDVDSAPSIFAVIGDVSFDVIMLNGDFVCDFASTPKFLEIEMRLLRRPRGVQPF